MADQIVDPQLEKFIQMIKVALPNFATVQNAAEQVKDQISAFIPWGEGQQATLQKAIEIVEKSLQPPEVIRRRSITARRPDWYSGPSPTHRQWNALKGFIANELKWEQSTIEKLDESSTEVLSLMPNPATAEFRSRGLVLGYVQSGKTANMTAVIAKAVDVGYNMIVVLGGTTNKLRAQTQRRLGRDIVSRHPDLWQLYTSDDDDGDFVRPRNGRFSLPVEGRAQLAVIKKECSRLESFLETARKTTAATLKALRVLIIDDECDQASVNASTGEDTTTRTNELIRKILHAFHAVSYVGYTATPFANVFINPYPEDGQKTDDLYPADFITMLEKPEGYTGTREVFQLDNPDADDDSREADGMGMLRRIPAAEVKQLIPGSSKKDAPFKPRMVDSLQHATLWFIASCAIRYLRGHEKEHMSMLVHTSALIEQHEKMAEVIKKWLDHIRPGLLAGNGPAWDLLASVYKTETSKIPLDPTHPGPTSMEQLHGQIVRVLNNLSITVENSVSEDRLDYTKEPCANIVVGGSVLARGLTLEGLSVSFFLRTSKQYDTLLQMGRWFGYRKGYSDLPRLWTTEKLISDFRALAVIEEEIREEIARYREDEDITPLDIAVKVRSIPGLAITSAAKMRHAYKTSVSFEGKHEQTIRFDHRNLTVVHSNWEAASRLFEDCTEKAKQDGKLFRDVPVESIRRFLREYSISDSHISLDGKMLRSYLDRSEDRHPFWNVALMSPQKKGKTSRKDLGPFKNVGLVVRAKIADTKNGHADIKALMSVADILVDAENKPEPGDKASWDAYKMLRPNRPLLLIYPIDAESNPRSESSERKKLDAVSDLIGIGIVFPGSKARSGEYYSVDLDVRSADEEEDDAAT